MTVLAVVSRPMVVLVVVTMSLVVVPTSEAGWSGATKVGSALEYDPGLVLAVSPRGWAATVTKTVDNRLAVAVRRPGRRFGRLQVIPHSLYGRQPAVMVDDRGGATIAWRYNDESDPAPPEARDEGCCVRVRVVTLGRARFGRIQTVSPRGSDVAGTLAFAGSRARALAWVADGTVEVAWASRRGAFRHPRKVGAGDPSWPRVFLAGGPGRALTATWRSHDTLVTARLTRRGRPVPKLALTLPGAESADLLTVAGDDRGRQSVLWTSHSVRSGSSQELRTAESGSGEAFRGPRTLWTGNLMWPAQAVAPSGGARVAAWSTSSSNGPGPDTQIEMVASRNRLRGPLLRGPHGDIPAVAAARTGLVAVLFGDPARPGVRALRALVWWVGRRPRRAVAIDRVDGSLGPPRVGFDARGRAVAVWDRASRRGTLELRAAFYRP